MRTIQQNILEIEFGIICQSVNCRGFMGAGLALQIREKWPEVYRTYRHSPARLGKVELIKVGNSLWVANLYAQDGIGEGKQTLYGAFAECLIGLKKYSQPLYFPYLIGCGLGGGSWPIISELIEYFIPGATICKL